jgi:hypothetical protein
MSEPTMPAEVQAMLRAFGAIVARRTQRACGRAEFGPGAADRAFDEWDVPRYTIVEAALVEFSRERRGDAGAR